MKVVFFRLLFFLRLTFSWALFSLIKLIIFNSNVKPTCHDKTIFYPSPVMLKQDPFSVNWWMHNQLKTVVQNVTVQTCVEELNIFCSNRAIVQARPSFVPGHSSSSYHDSHKCEYGTKTFNWEWDNFQYFTIHLLPRIGICKE